LRTYNFRITALQGLLAPVQEIITLVALLAMIAFLAFYVADRRPAELAVFLVFFFAARAAMPMFTGLQTARAAIAAKKPRIAALTRLLDDGDKFSVADGSVDFTGLQRSIVVRDLHFGYADDRPVLKGVNATFKQGEMTAIVGPTGAGKSTLIHLLMGFYAAPPGSISLDGRDLRSLRIASLRRRIALVSQDAFLFNDTLRANLLVGCEEPPAPPELAEMLARARLADFVASLSRGLDTRIGDRGVQLSGGEKQRVAICRALLQRAEILILDEATSALDSETERLLQEAIDAAVAQRTAIVIAHRLSTIRQADRILVLEDGRVTEEGDLDSLLGRNGRFAALWRAQGFSDHV
jgi:subfamily B ATP-binding cassette protein MsbA